MERRDPADQIAEVATLVRHVLGSAAIGAYLHGSTATSRLRPHSDIDILVVSARPTSFDERQRLIERLLAISGSGDPTGRSRSIELTIVAQPDVRPWRYPPRLDFQYGDWHRDAFRRGDRAPWASPNPDVAVVLTMALQANCIVFGPTPSEVLDAVPARDLAAAIVDGIPGLLADLDTDTANVILTFARIWVTLATGQIRSKDEAADWCLERLANVHRPVLARARAVYLGEAADRWSDLHPLVRPCVDELCATITVIRGGGAGGEKPRTAEEAR